MGSPRLSGDQYRLLVEAHPTMVWRAGLDAKCDYFNETWLQFTGRTMEQEVGNGWAEGVHPDDFQGCLDIYLSHFHKRLPFEMEYRLRRHDGVYRYIFDRGVPYQDERGVFAGFIGSCVDVDDRRTAEASKSKFLSLVAHELRTPLTSIQAFLHGALARARRGDRVEPQVLEMISAQSQRFANLAQELGDFASVDARVPLRMQPEKVDLAALVRDVTEQYVAALALLSEAPSISVEVIPDRAPAEIDPRRVEQVLLNLMENARKYSSGRPFSVRLERVDGELRLSVIDQGIGIPKEELGSVGRRFFRASNASDSQYPGVGIGLYLCRMIAEAHGGRLEIHNNQGTGTRATLVVPARRG